jgi:non-specific serine/threonine protein kinase
MAECLEGCAAVAGAAGQPRRAARLYGAADALREATGAPVSTMDRAEHDELLGRIRTRLGPHGFAAEWAAGRAIELEEATQLARLAIAAGDIADTRGTATLLTRREREVAAHVADGMTNREIARQLMVAERTVETHLEHIFDKLGARTRADVAVWMTRQDLESSTSSSATLVPRVSGRLGTSR